MRRLDAVSARALSLSLVILLCVYLIFLILGFSFGRERVFWANEEGAGGGVGFSFWVGYIYVCMVE